MAELDILELVVSPTLRLAVEFEPAAVAPVSYRVDATGPGGHVVTARGEAPIIFCGALRYGTDYSVTVTAEQVDSELDVTGTAEDLEGTPSEPVSHAAALRQSVSDILSDAALSLDGQTVNMQRTRFGLVAPVRESKPRGKKGPWIDVREPLVTPGRTLGGVRQDLFDVPIRLVINKQDGDVGQSRLNYLLSKVQTTIDGTDSLNLGSAGVLDQTWRWKQPRKIKARGDTHVWEVVLAVPVNIRLGVPLFA